MLHKVAQYQFLVDAYLSDFRGRATLPMIGGFMLKAATRHAEERRFGYSEMTARKRVWVLSRMAIEIYDYPKNDTHLFVKTWVSDVNKLFTERCFSFQDDNNKTIGYAKSIWASIDIETRRPTNVLELVGLTDYIDKDEPCQIDGMKKVVPLKDVSITSQFEIKYSDIDINKHLNSMKYIEYFVDMFDLTTFKAKEIRRFEINYISEGKYGSVIDLLRKDESENISVLEMKSNDSVISTSRITWS